MTWFIVAVALMIILIVLSYAAGMAWRDETRDLAERVRAALSREHGEHKVPRTGSPYATGEQPALPTPPDGLPSVAADRPVTPLRSGAQPWKTGEIPAVPDLNAEYEDWKRRMEACDWDRVAYVRSRMEELARMPQATGQDVRDAAAVLRGGHPYPVYNQAPVATVLAAEQQELTA